MTHPMRADLQEALSFPIMLHRDYGDSERSDSVTQARKAGDAFVVVCLPWKMIAPYEAQAQRNHSQTLKRLAERGGLSAEEALCVLDGLEWRHRKHNSPASANRELAKRIIAWNTRSPAEGEGVVVPRDTLQFLLDFAHAFGRPFSKPLASEFDAAILAAQAALTPAEEGVKA